MVVVFYFEKLRKVDCGGTKIDLPKSILTFKI